MTERYAHLAPENSERTVRTLENFRKSSESKKEKENEISGPISL